MLTAGVMASPATNATVLSNSLFLMACSSVVSLARAADVLRLDLETSEREHRSDAGAIWCDGYRISFIQTSRANSMREQPVEKFMLCYDESARMP